MQILMKNIRKIVKRKNIIVKRKIQIIKTQKIKKWQSEKQDDKNLRIGKWFI